MLELETEHWAELVTRSEHVMGFEAGCSACVPEVKGSDAGVVLGTA